MILHGGDVGPRRSGPRRKTRLEHFSVKWIRFTV
jgi:hypothetical protein